MSVRKVYNLLLDGHLLFSGSYSSVLACYRCVASCLDYLNISGAHTLCVSFVPSNDF